MLKTKFVCSHKILIQELISLTLVMMKVGIMIKKVKITSIEYDSTKYLV